MHVASLSIRNIRSLQSFEISLRPDERTGWHVILGSNGAGKSSVIRSLAAVLAGPKEVAALRQEWRTWQRHDAPSGQIEVRVIPEPCDIFTGTGRRAASIDAKVKLERIETSIGTRYDLASGVDAKSPAWRTIWGNNGGWFSASFGPFRRFTGGDREYDRLFFSNPRLAPHLSAFGEDVALTEGLQWLQSLRIKSLEYAAGKSDLLETLVAFLNKSGLLPHGARIDGVRSDAIMMVDGAGVQVAIEQMSDGYRSVLSMIFEIIRQMSVSFGDDELLKFIDVESSTINAPGVVCIDEVDAHLHPSWQRDIGPWFVRCFPNLQFFVTTHSPIVCRTARTVWRLPAPGESEPPGRVEGVTLDRLVYGSIIDAYGTDLFGTGVVRSDASKAKLAELAQLNRKSLRAQLSPAEKGELERLRAILPTTSSSTS